MASLSSIGLQSKNGRFANARHPIGEEIPLPEQARYFWQLLEMLRRQIDFFDQSGGSSPAASIDFATAGYGLTYPQWKKRLLKRGERYRAVESDIKRYKENIADIAACLLCLG